MTWGEIIIGLMSASALVMASWLTVRGNSRAKAHELATLPPADVRSRLDNVEKRVGVLQTEQWVDREYMRRMLSAWPPGHALPLPMPGWLAEHYGLPPQHPLTPGSIIQPPPRRTKE